MSKYNNYNNKIYKLNYVNKKWKIKDCNYNLILHKIQIVIKTIHHQLVEV